MALAPLRGAINDREVNYYPVAGGERFSTDISGTAAVSLGASVKATQVRDMGFLRAPVTLPVRITKLDYIHSMGGKSTVQLPAHSALTYGHTLGGHSETVVDTHAEATQAFTLGGLSESTIFMLGRVNTFASFAGTMGLGVELNGLFERTFISRWKMVRRINVPFGMGRRLALQAEYRKVNVPAAVPTLARQKDDVLK